MWCRSVAGAALGVGVLLGPAPLAAAQPVYSLRPELSVRETYDDNVDRVAVNRRDDFITAIGAGVTFAARGRQLATSARYGVEAAFFAKGTEDQGQLMHEGAVSVAYQATRRLGLSLADSARLARTSEPDARLALPPPAPAPGPGPVPVELPPVGPGGIPTRRVRQFANTAAAALEYQLDAFTKLNGGYSLEIARFDAPDLVDTDTHRVSGGATRQIAHRDRLGVTYTFSLFQFDTPGLEDRQAHEAIARWEHDFAPSLTAELDLGGAFTERESGFEGGAVGGAAATKRIGRTRYSASYHRTIATSGGTGEVLRSDRVAAGVVHEFAPWLMVQAGVAYARNEPIGGAAAATNSYSATASVMAQLTRSLRLVLGYSFERSEAPAGQTSFRDNQVTAGLTLLLPAVESASF